MPKTAKKETKEKRIKKMRRQLRVEKNKLTEINDMLLSPKNETITRLLNLIDKHGGPDKINARAKRAKDFDFIMRKLKRIKSPYVDGLKWLMRMQNEGRFVSMDQYRENLLGKEAKKIQFNQKNAVTLEISALQYFPWLIREAEKAISNLELMPGRYIRVRNMAEQVKDNGDTLAMAAAMQIIGASCVNTLDTKGLMPHPNNPEDPANCHLGGPDTLTGYFGGIGQPNDFPYLWAKEALYYYMNYGVSEVLNINPGTVILSHLMYKLGVNIDFKISVFMGIDNAPSILNTLLMAKLLSRAESTSLVGFNLSNSADNDTIRLGAQIRELLGFTHDVRFEHHITEPEEGIVIQPYCRREDIVEISEEVANLAAKHEGPDPTVKTERPSSIFDYFMPKAEIEKAGLMDTFLKHYLQKHDALQITAEMITANGIAVNAARNLH